MLMGGFHLLALFLKLLVERWEVLPEVLQRTVKERLRNEQVFLHVLLIHLVTSLTGEDDQLTNHILTAQVHSWVWLCITLFFGSAHGLTEWYIRRNRIEDEVQRTAQHSLQFQNLVTRIDEVIDSVDDRQTSTYIRLKQIFHTALSGRGLQSSIIIVVTRCSHLVGSHHRDVITQECLIQPCHIGTCRAIHKHAVENIHADDFLLQTFQIACLGSLQTSTQLCDGKLAVLFPLREVNAVSVEHRIVSTGNAHHIDLQVALLHQFLTLTGYLLQQAATHCANTAEEYVQHLILRQEERVVNHVQ